MLKLRPHHIIDILRDYGQDKEFTPHQYGHDYHVVAKKIIENINQIVKLVVSADDICSPCFHLQPDKSCNDILFDHPYPYSNLKQTYNDYLDKKILGLLSLNDNIEISINDYLSLLVKNIDLFDKIYPHSVEIIEQRKTSFKNGLIKLGIS